MRLFVHRQPTYGRWTDGLRLSDRLLLTTEERKEGKRAYYYNGRVNVKRRRADLFKSLPSNYLKKKCIKAVGDGGERLRARARAHLYVCARLGR